MRRFEAYPDAYDYAVELARKLSHDTYICAQKEFGKDGFNVGLAEPFGRDSVHGTSEIVTPKHPKVQR